MKTIVIAFTAWLVFSPAHAFDLTGVPRIVDGDTLAIGSTKVRLQGIDAPETDQVCLNANGDHWTCGIEARDQLAVHIGGRDIRCSSNGIDAYQRTLGTCYLGLIRATLFRLTHYLVLGGFFVGLNLNDLK
jgi:endonuclease YncB( thermonuclease family)